MKEAKEELEEKLKAEIVKRGKDPKGYGIDGIFRIMNPHPELIELPRMVVGLLNALDAAEKHPEVLAEGLKICDIREVCNCIISLKDDDGIGKNLGDRFLPVKPLKSAGLVNPVKDKNPGLNRHGVPYAAFWLKPRDSERASDYWRLVAQLLLALNNVDNEVSEGHCYGAYRALEFLSAADYLDIPTELPVWESHQRFVSACRRFRPGKSRSIQAKHFAKLCLLVRKCAGEEPAKQSKGGGGGGRTVDQPEVITHTVPDVAQMHTVDDPEDPFLLPGYYEIVRADTRDEGEELGELAPGEMVPAIETWLLDDHDVDRPYVADILSQQAVVEHVVRSRQMLPYSYGQLTLTELARLLFGASDIFEECIRSLRSAPDVLCVRLRMEAILFIHISLWLGQPPTRIAQMTVSEAGEEFDSPLTLVTGGQPYFQVVVPKPPLAGDTRWQAETGVREAVQHVLLPDLAGSGSLVTGMDKVFPRTSNRVFSYQTSVLEAEARKLLRELGEDDSRYTLHKIRNFLLQRIYQTTSGDIAAASMLSGVCPPTADTPRFYLQPSAEHLCTCYVQALEQLLVQIYACVGLAYEPEKVSLDQPGAVGATHCLLPETVSNNVQALKQVIAKSPRGSLSDMVRWHNHFTLWTVQMFLMASSCRAIRNPLRWVDEFYPQLVAGALSDKGSEDMHMSRLIQLPHIVREQVRRYEEHCRETERQLTGYLASDPDERWTHGFFLSLDADRILREPIRPGVIFDHMQLVEGYTPHRVNAFRKLVRTELFERGCPGEVLSAYMGHWLRGEEPQDAFATFCPATYMRTLDQYLVPFMSELGWSVMAKRWGDA